MAIRQNTVGDMGRGIADVRTSNPWPSEIPKEWFPTLRDSPLSPKLFRLSGDIIIPSYIKGGEEEQ